MEKYLQHFKTLVIGAGPAGTGLLYNAISRNELREFLDSGIGFVDRTEDFGSGTIGRYMINSDTAAGVFLECLQTFKVDTTASKRLEQMITLLSRKKNEPVPLEWVGDYLKLLGTHLKTLVNSNHKSHFFSGTEVVSASQHTGGGFTVIMKKSNSETFSVETDSLVFAMGGWQDNERMYQQEIAGGVHLSDYYSKIVTTDDLFTRKGFSKSRERLDSSGNKKIAIIGGSHSAFASIQLFLKKTGNNYFAENDITLLHRNKLKLFYPTAEEANNEGYFDFTDDDICPLTKKVYRLAGLRLESREVLKTLLGIGNKADKRLKRLELKPEFVSEIKNTLDEAEIIIPAFGYRPRTIPVYSEKQRVTLLAETGGPLVNKHCQVLDSEHRVIENLYGIGLASGFVPWGELGGEPGFRGQTNGLWLYQNGVGAMIYVQLKGVKKTEKEIQIRVA